MERAVREMLGDGAVVRPLARHTAVIDSAGRRIDVDYRVAPYRDAAGNVSGVVMSFDDITSRKDTEARLRHALDANRRQAHLMNIAFESISEGVIAVDEAGDYLIFNPAAEQIVGMHVPDARLGERSERYGLFHVDGETVFPSSELPIARAVRGESTDGVELLVRNRQRPEGVFVSIDGRPLRDESGALKGGIIVFRDVTERRRAEEALLEAFDQGRLEMADTMLHNIGNAINSVSVGVGTVQEYVRADTLMQRLTALAAALDAHRDDWIGYLTNDPQGRQALPFLIALAGDLVEQRERLEKTVARVADRVAHIIDIIRTQRSFGAAMMRKEIDLRQAIVDAVKVLHESLAKRGIEIRIDCRAAPPAIRVQESKFHQLLVNLVKNAMEAIVEHAHTQRHPQRRSARPRIGVRAYVQAPHLIVEVSDTGIGIASERTKVIFTPGYTTKREGSGLGLHSAANYVIGSGGSIDVLSDGIGTGTTIRVKWPLASVSPPPPGDTGSA